jgi:hypothetical protein
VNKLFDEVAQVPNGVGIHPPVCPPAPRAAEIVQIELV